MAKRAITKEQRRAAQIVRARINREKWLASMPPELRAYWEKSACVSYELAIEAGREVVIHVDVEA